MKILEVDSGTNLNHILNEIKNTSEDGLELTSVPETDLLENPINRAIIEKVAKEHKKEIVFPSTDIEKAPEVEEDDLGFVEGEDVFQKAPIQEAHKIIATAAVASAKPARSSKFNLPKLFKNKWVWVGVGVVIVLSLLVGSFFLLPAASVAITPKAESKDTQVTLTGITASKDPDTGTNTISYKSAQVSKDGAGESSTTGKKTIGTAAKGRVTITNQDTDAAKTFVAGTIISPISVPNSTSVPSVTFKIDADVSLDKAPVGGETSAGVNITATKAGSDGNLPANSIFKVGTSSTTFVFAKNDVAFAGGESKLATVASAEDREALKKSIIDKLEEQAKGDIEKKQKGSVVVVDSYETTVTKETYDPKAVDAETDTLKATVSIDVKAAYVNKDDLNKIVINSLKESAKGYNVKEEDLKITLTQSSKDESGNIKMIAKVQAQLTPGISNEELQRHLAGKSTEEAKKYLDSVDQIAAYKVTTTPFYFRIFGRMPFSASKIKISYQ